MDKQIQLKPDYKRIYNDLIEKKFPEKKVEFISILKKEKFSVLDVIQLNQRIFGVTEGIDHSLNQKHRSYDKSTILQILDYQCENKLNNTQLALEFKISRNTIAKWKKYF